MSAIALPRPGTPVLAPRGFALRAFGDEAGKGLRLMWRRRAVTIAGVVTLGLTYLSIQFFIGGGHIVVPVLALTLPALFGASFAYVTSVSGAGGIAEEVNGGTLEQAHLSPASPSLLLAGRLAALAVEGLVTAAALALVFGLGYRPHWVIRPDALVPLALTVLDALGYALLMTALVLRIAAIGAVVHVFNMAIMFFGGLYVPITLFPHGIEIFARFLPTALGTEALNTTLADRGLSAAWSDGTLPWLIVHVVVTGGLGWATYLHTLRRARREGGLSPR
jgi:ABC-2 type transport system permease protein